MAAIASTDVTLTVEKARAGRPTKFNRVKIAFGDGLLTYPSGGVPLPTTITAWGMKKVLEDLLIEDDNDAVGILWKYDKANHKLRGYITGITVAAAGSATLDDFPLDTTAEPLATTVSVSLTNNTGAGAKYLGSLLELATTHAPAAQVLYVQAIGQ